jgi:hypothetical protein
MIEKETVAAIFNIQQMLKTLENMNLTGTIDILSTDTRSIIEDYSAAIRHLEGLLYGIKFLYDNNNFDYNSTHRIRRKISNTL